MNCKCGHAKEDHLDLVNGGRGRCQTCESVYGTGIMGHHVCKTFQSPVRWREFTHQALEKVQRALAEDLSIDTTVTPTGSVSGDFTEVKFIIHHPAAAPSPLQRKMEMIAQCIAMILDPEVHISEEREMVQDPNDSRTRLPTGRTTVTLITPKTPKRTV